MLRSQMQESYNTGDYINAVVNRQKAETISSVLYPDDRSYQVCSSNWEKVVSCTICLYIVLPILNFENAPSLNFCFPGEGT